MRVDMKTASGKKEMGSAQLLGLIAVPFICGYLLATPAIAAYMPASIERALTNFRTEIDKAGEGALTFARDALAMVGWR